MKCSLGISNFPEEISSLSHSIVFLYFFALIAEEGFLISLGYSLELCIQMGISFLFSFTFRFSLFHSLSLGKCKSKSQWQQAKCPSTNEWLKIWCIHNRILVSLKKEWNCVICNNMDGLGDCYAKWNKSVRERQIPSDIPYMWNLKSTTM